MDEWSIQHITKAITSLGFFCAIFFAYYYYLRFRNKERILLIEKNVDLSEVYKKSDRYFPWYMIGFTILGVGVGFITALGFAFIMNANAPLDKDIVDVLFISTSILFGALGIIVGHSIDQKKKVSRG